MMGEQSRYMKLSLSSNQRRGALCESPMMRKRRSGLVSYSRRKVGGHIIKSVPD